MRRALPLVALLVTLGGCGATHRPHQPGFGRTPKGLVSLPRLVTGVATGVMYDTVTLSTVPANPFATAGYTSGYWPTFLPLRSRYPSAHTVSIAVTARNHADCLDVEPGDATPSQAGPWARADLAAGFPKPCLYSDLSHMPQVKANLAAWLGSNWRARVFLWLAWYRYTPGLVTGYDAVQWTDHAYGRNLDQSTVSLQFLSIAHPPYVAPANPLEARLRALNRVLRRYGCRARRHRHERLGPKCRRWFAEGDAIHRTLGK